MEYKLWKTKTIHWDEEGVFKLHPNCVIRWVSTAEIYKVHEGKLPIILEANPILFDNDIAIFSAIMHTKALLTFKEQEDPINDIIKMWKECYLQEVSEFRNRGKGTMIEFLELEDIEHKPDATFNGAYNLRDVAITKKLVKLP